jgi:hypothetical protein
MGSIPQTRRTRSVWPLLLFTYNALAFDNCPDQRIDNGIPRQRAFAR